MARRLSMTGEVVDAARAEKIGLVTEVVAHERLLDRALELAGQIAEVPGPVMSGLKEIYRTGTAAVTDPALKAERVVSAAIHVSTEQWPRGSVRWPSGTSVRSGARMRGRNFVGGGCDDGECPVATSLAPLQRLEVLFEQLAELAGSAMPSMGASWTSWRRWIVMSSAGPPGRGRWRRWWPGSSGRPRPTPTPSPPSPGGSSSCCAQGMREGAAARSGRGHRRPGRRGLR